MRDTIVDKVLIFDGTFIMTDVMLVIDSADIIEQYENNEVYKYRLLLKSIMLYYISKTLSDDFGIVVTYDMFRGKLDNVPMIEYLEQNQSYIDTSNFWLLCRELAAMMDYQSRHSYVYNVFIDINIINNNIHVILSMEVSSNDSI